MTLQTKIATLYTDLLMNVLCKQLYYIHLQAADLASCQAKLISENVTYYYKNSGEFQNLATLISSLQTTECYD